MHIARVASAVLFISALAMSASAASSVGGEPPVMSLGQVVGRPKGVDVRDEKVVEAAKHAVDHFNDVSNDMFYYKFVRVVEATQQLVAGVKYKLTLELAPTTAVKGRDDANDVINREVDMSRTKTILVTVLSQPWNPMESRRWQVSIERELPRE